MWGGIAAPSTALDCMPRPTPRSQMPPRPVDPPGVPTRRAALKLLDAVLRRGQALEAALHNATQGLEGPDRALAHAIAAETLRRLPDLDALIDGMTPRALPEDAKARMVLRIALTQMLVLGTPAHAAIATALPLVDGGPRKLVHGVIGALDRAAAGLPARIGLPGPVALRWRAAHGEAMVDAAAAALASRAPLDLTFKDAAGTADWAERLGGVSLAPGHVRLPADSPVPDLPGYGDGAWWVQDLAASLPARMLGAGEGRAIIDACAAPGGKTMQLAAQGWRVTALDRSPARLDRMATNLARTGLSADLVAADALGWMPETPVAAVLLDAPCSATGIFRRHPDVLHRVGERQIAELAEAQRALLDHVAGWIAPGGLLVYATCSLETAEGENQIARFLSDHGDFNVISPLPEALPAGISPKQEGWIRTGPADLAGAGGVDGFFIAMLGRN